MNRTKTKEIYGRDYCVFCMEEAEVVVDIWEDFYFCSCIDSKTFNDINNTISIANKDIAELEITCNLERSYRKMIQLELL